MPQYCLGVREGGLLANDSKTPWRDFDYNLRKARGLVRLQFYADDLFRTGGKESFGKLTSFLADLMVSFGFEDLLNFEDLIRGKVSPIIEKELGPIIAARFTTLDEKKLDAAAKEFERRVLPRVEEIRAIIEEIALVVERVLLEQALVTAVTALEVYLKDVTTEVVARNRFLEKRFSRQLHNSLRYRDVTNAGWDSGLAAGKVVGESYDFYDPKSVAKHLRTLLGEKAPLRDTREQSEFARILAYRHLIVHRAGIVSRQFRQQTGYRGSLDEPVAIRREFVEQGLRLVLNVGNKVQKGLEDLRFRGS